MFEKKHNPELTVLFFKRAQAVQNADEALLEGDLERYYHWREVVKELNERIQIVKKSARLNITASDERSNESIVDHRVKLDRSL